MKRKENAKEHWNGMRSPSSWMNCQSKKKIKDKTFS